MKRRIFYSFHYEADSWRAGMVRNIGVIEANRPATDNDWETVKRGGNVAIERWIARQMNGRSCTIVLVGSQTAGRYWINHEIIKSWNDGMGVVGIHIHGLEDSRGYIAAEGANPFQQITYGNPRRPLSSAVKCYNPAGSTSQERYNWIRKYLSAIVEDAISIRHDAFHAPKPQSPFAYPHIR